MMGGSRNGRDPHGIGMTSLRARDRLIETLRGAGIHDVRVIDALRRVPRHLFVDEGLESRAYENSALPIGLGQTISQPYVVALMTQAVLAARVPQRVLEVGTGSGYQAAVLAQLVDQVYSVERIEKLLRQARRRFLHAGYANIKVRHADGRLGWPEEAPFDAIVVTAAGDRIDDALLAQLAPAGVLVAPVGPPGAQRLVRVTRGEAGDVREELESVAFVPLLGGVV